MPKETIRALGESHVVYVGWSKDGSPEGAVQVSTVNHSAGSHSDDPAAGWWVDLDRDGLNHLIRSLRKARDQAYGSDA